MSKFGKQVKKIARVLKLETVPIGARFSENPNRRGTQQKLRICEALNVVKNENIIINLSKENCTCAGGRHFAGLQALPLEAIATTLSGKEHRVYKSKSIAQASLSKQPQPIHRGNFLILGPLEKFDTDPDIVLFCVNPAQADKILGLVSFSGAEPFRHYSATSICSTITNTLAKGKPDINFVSVFERRRGKWSQNELILALPFKDFLVAMESIPNSGFGKLPKRNGVN